jgi:hypothetical protein
MSRTDASSGPPRFFRPSTESIAAWALGGPLAVALAVLVCVQLLLWVPYYLTWPWWTDHDVFATLAHGWDAGRRPYRDLVGNNFPATIYLFWVLGKLFGWGRTAPLYAFDAGLVGLLGVLMISWSRRVLRRALPALVGYTLFLGYYLCLDYTQAAQRDWHGPFFLVSALLLVQGWPGSATRVGAGLLSALAFATRPQVILLLPAMVVSLCDDTRSEHRAVTTRRAIGEWVFALLIGLGLAFAPLVFAGLFADFSRAVRLVAYGGPYNTVGALGFAKQLVDGLAPTKYLAIPAALLLLGARASRCTRRTALVWLLAFLGVLFYRPLSPVPHAYLTHPLVLVWSVLAAVVVGVVLEDVRLRPSRQLVAIVLLLGLGGTFRPRFCHLGGLAEVVTALRLGSPPIVRPAGYAGESVVSTAARYPWEDYRQLLDYLKSELPPDTRVANALVATPALTGPTGRLPALPAESIAWLLMVNPADEDRFITALDGAPDSVAVWAPAEVGVDPLFRVNRLAAAIRDRYEPARRFGTIEVWTRKAGG